MDYLKFCVESTITVRDAMRQLDKTAKKILFVLKDRKLSGALTDGDVRRYLLAGGKMDDTVDRAANHHPVTASSREQAEELLNSNGYIALPVVNMQGELVDVIFKDGISIHEFPHLGLPVVIMAGGKGTRLDPYTRVLPKALIPVGELPIIEHIMEQFMKYSCDDFHIVVNHRKQLIKAYFAENERRYRTHWYDEEKPLGTGGGLYMLRGKIKKTFFLTNCDILVQTDYDDILRFHRENGNVITMVCAYKNMTVPYGVIETGENGIIKSMREKPEFSFLTNTGMYIVEPGVLEDIEDEVPIGFPDIVEKQKQKGHHVAVYPVSENDWLDMGQMTELEKMRDRLYGE
jgi:dTDP-glucose pyrophosphorylase